MSATKNFPHNLTLLFDNATHDRLVAMTEKGRFSKAHVIRQAIENMHRMKVERRPTCADGGSCHCPHTHTHLG